MGVRAACAPPVRARRVRCVWLACTTTRQGARQSVQTLVLPVHSAWEELLATTVCRVVRAIADSAPLALSALAAPHHQIARRALLACSITKLDACWSAQTPARQDQFSTGGAATSMCTPCGAGMYNNGTGRTSECTDECPAGTFSSGGAINATCTPCMAGMYNIGTGLASECTDDCRYTTVCRVVRAIADSAPLARSLAAPIIRLHAVRCWHVQ